MTFGNWLGHRDDASRLEAEGLAVYIRSFARLGQEQEPGCSGGDERFDSEEIHRLYESDDYPLGRRTG